MHEVLKSFGLEGELSGGCGTAGFLSDPAGELFTSECPATGEVLAQVRGVSKAQYDAIVDESTEAFRAWRTRPAPERGELVRRIGMALRERKDDLGKLTTLECGKILSEGLGEVQEMIDMADLAVGMSRQLYGLTMHSERPQHRMYEQWHPMGPVGVISAFNFPVAVWAWNAFVAAACGDSVIWKPSEKTPLTAIAVTQLCREVAADMGHPGLFTLTVGARDIGEAMAQDRRLPIVSATGSCRMGRSVGETVAARMGRSILELGGNNAIIVMDDADLDLATRAIAFGAVGTAGQRCTTTRRVFAQSGIVGELCERLTKAYGSVPIGDPLDSGTLMGPLIDADAVAIYEKVVARVPEEGGEILHGGKTLDRAGHYVEPALCRSKADMPLLKEENFVPVLHVVEVKDLDEAMSHHNAVDQGLSSAIFTDSVRSAERFLSAAGSDCGIANVNIGTSGAEIGGAFGGEKDTGGGREAGSDAWKAYMRRQTCTINWGEELPLAQGVEFDV
ncbi:MAG: aldehyde dehydrogenase family protein [Acidobacteriota bacterium]